MTNTLRIRVRIGDQEAEISYPLSERNVVSYGTSGNSTLDGSIKAVEDLVRILKTGTL